MPKEKSDNTRVLLKPKIKVIPKEEVLKLKRKREVQLFKLDLLNDADEVEMYLNMQDYYNSNFWGAGISGVLSNNDPRTPEGQAAIESNFQYAKDNARNFAETLVTSGLIEGAGQVIKYLTTPVEIGSGAEAIVKSSPISLKVTKQSTIPRTEMHIRNQVPGAVKAEYVGTENGLEVYKLSKVKVLTALQLAKIQDLLLKFMESKGWTKVTHKNLEGPGFTNGKWVISDLGQGNVGVDLLGRPRLIDFVIETPNEFRLAMERKGGRLYKLQKGTNDNWYSDLNDRLLGPTKVQSISDTKVENKDGKSHTIYLNLGLNVSQDNDSSFVYTSNQQNGNNINSINAHIIRKNDGTWGYNGTMGG